MIGLLILGPVEEKTNIRFKKKDDFENCISGIDIDYASEVFTYTGYAYKSNTPHFEVVKRNASGKDITYMQ